MGGLVRLWGIVFDVKEVCQTIVGEPHGNCMQACIASLLELPLEDVPNFVMSVDHWAVLDEYLEQFDVYLVMVPLVDGWRPTGYHIVDGKSSRGIFHWVVGFNGEIVHDPYPVGDGLVEVHYWGLLARRLETLSGEKGSKLTIGYEYAGKIGPWARRGVEGTRYLSVGLQGHYEYCRIVKAEKDGNSWHYVRVEIEGGETLLRGCNTNVYKRR